MKKFLLLCLLAQAAAGFVFAQNKPDSANAQTHGSAIIYFPGGTVYDFGDIPEGPNVAHVFEYINKGNTPLVIFVTSCCGSLAFEYSKEPVMPGEKGWVKAIFTTKCRPGKFYTKTLDVYSIEQQNISETIVLTVKGNVLPAEIPAEQSDHFKKTH